MPIPKSTDRLRDARTASAPTAEPRSHPAAIAFAAVLMLLALHGGWFIYRTSFTVEGRRWFVLSDEAMISMRYARNLAAGNGLAWNAVGERAEGFPNPLWTLCMAAIHRLPLAPSRTSAAVQVTALLLLLVNLGFVRALARRVAGSEGVALVAVFLTATYFPLEDWALQGLEVGLLAVWATCGCWLLVRALEERRGMLPLCIVAAAGTLVRIDAAVPAAAMLLLAALLGRERWKRLGLPVAIAGGTFFRRDRRILALLAVVVVELLYGACAGGDGGSDRFTSIVMPVFSVLLGLFANDIRRAVWRRIETRGAAPRFRFLATPIAAAVVSGVALLLNHHGGIRASVRRWAVVERPLHVEENRRAVRLALRLEELTAPGATLSVVRAGTLPYFCDRRCVFEWGDEHSSGELRPDVIADTWPGIQASPSWADYYAYDLGMLGKVYPRIDSQKLRLSPGDALASQLWWRGLALEGQERWDEAIHLFGSAIATGTYNEEWRYHYGAVFVEHRPLAEVEAYYDSTAARDPKPQTSHYMRGVALARAGRLDQAVEWFRRALAVDPAHEMSHEMWGNVLASQGRHTEADEHYRLAIRISPDYARLHQLLAASLRRQGKEAEALYHQEAAARVGAEPARRNFHWGRFLLEQGRVDAAIAELERALEADPDDREARRLLQRARQSAGTAKTRG